jgi:uncharacterized membrane-anchored protein
MPLIYGPGIETPQPPVRDWGGPMQRCLYNGIVTTVFCTAGIVLAAISNAQSQDRIVTVIVGILGGLAARVTLVYCYARLRPRENEPPLLGPVTA